MSESERPPVDPLRVFGHAVGIALSDRKVPDDWDTENLTPSQVIEGAARLLDKLDDATDAYLAAHGETEPTSRRMQRDLRALASPAAPRPEGLPSAAAQAFLATQHPAPSPEGLDVERARLVFHAEYEADHSGDRYYGCQHRNQHRSTWDCQQRVDDFAAEYQRLSDTGYTTDGAS